MRCVLYLLLIVLSLSTATADTSYPVPSSISMERGDETEFTFQIQNFRSNDAIICNFAVEEDNGLELGFPEEVRVNGGNRLNVKGTVGVPGGLDDGRYTANFCVHCRPDIEDFGGSTVRTSDCGLPVNVVVGRVEDGRLRFEDYGLYVFGGAVLMVLILLVIARRRKR